MTTCKYKDKCPAYYNEDLLCDKRYTECQLYKFREHLRESGLMYLIETKKENLLPEEIE